MTIKPFYKVFAALLMSVTMVGANASSVSFDMASYDGTSGPFSVTINYDFTDFAMFGGGLNLAYDSSVLELVSYTRADHSADQAQDAASPVGALGAPGEYLGFGVGTFDFFGGMQDAGQVGTFVFNVLEGGSGSTALILSPNWPINPFTTLAGADVTFTEFFPNGDIVVGVQTAVIPVPAAVWFMLSGIGALLGMRRRA